MRATPRAAASRIWRVFEMRTSASSAPSAHAALMRRSQVWFDGGLPNDTTFGQRIVDLMNEYQPETAAYNGYPYLINDVRWIGTEAGAAPDPSTCCALGSPPAIATTGNAADAQAHEHAHVHTVLSPPCLHCSVVDGVVQSRVAESRATTGGR